jgi:hypothetical protein
MNAILFQTLVEYLWNECNPGSFENDRHAAKNLETMFGISEKEAQDAVKFGPGWGEDQE